MVDRIPNEPAPYMNVEDVWSDRRDPHANPLSTSPRREIARPDPKASGLNGLLKFLYVPTATDEPRSKGWRTGLKESGDGGGDGD